MGYSSYTDFLSKYLPIFQNANWENHKNVAQKQKKTGLKGEILYRAIVDDFYKRQF